MRGSALLASHVDVVCGGSVHGCGCGRCQFVVFVIDPGIGLVGGSGPHEGRVEVYHNGTWGTVCSNGWDLRDATVVCRELGYIKTAAVLGSARFGAGSGPILFSELSCIGNESVITECGHDDNGGHNCSHSEDVGVVCGQCVCVEGGREGVYLLLLFVCIGLTRLCGYFTASITHFSCLLVHSSV